MSNIFNPDNMFFTIVNKIVDIIIVSLLWTIMSLPLITMGPASSAMYYTCVKVIRKDRGYVFKSFFHSFKENFKLGAIFSLLYVVYAVVIYIDFRYANAAYQDGQTSGTVLYYVFTFFTVIMFFIFVWIYPILSRFTLSFKQLLTDTVIISLRHLPQTVIMCAFIGGVLYAIYRFLPLPFYVFLPLILPGLSMFLRSFLIEPVLKKYLNDPEGTPEETGEDQWYRE